MTKLKIDSALIRFTDSKDFKELYFSLPDLCKGFDGEAKRLVNNWMRTRATLNFFGAWEQQFNSNFKVIEFDNLMRYAGDNTFSMSATKWIEQTGGKCIYLKKGRGGGTYGHILIALHFANWLSADFYLKFTESYFDLLENKYGKNAIDKEVKRTFARLNYPLQTEAVKLFIPLKADEEVQRRTYANEADMLNKIVFHYSAKEWRAMFPKKKGNQRDHATEEQVHVIANLEYLNSFLIKNGFDQEERFEILKNEAQQQLDFFAKYKQLDQ
ncbi:MAG: KilA-N domain-containing protein [Bacteroidota bacterium]